MLDIPRERLTLDRITTPLGQALLITDENHRLRALDWEDHAPRMQRLLRLPYGSSMPLEPGRAPGSTRTALDAYFAGGSSNWTASSATRVARRSSVRFGRPCGRSRRGGQ